MKLQCACRLLLTHEYKGAVEPTGMMYEIWLRSVGHNESEDQFQACAVKQCTSLRS